MHLDRRSVVRLAGPALALLVVGAAFYQRAASNLARIDYRNSNFVFFWLAGRMVWDGGNPYDSAQWLSAQQQYGVAWRPDQIFTYPLPLAFFMAPVGSLPLSEAYFGWQLVSEVLIATAVWVLLSRTNEERHKRLFVPLILLLLFFGPVYLTLQVGALGAFMLISVLVAITSWERKREVWGGLALTLTLLKPPQGATILLLAVTWLLARRNWRAVGGILAGGAGLLLVGLLADPHWIEKSAGMGQALLGRNLGLQSNTVGFAHLACRRDLPCTWLLGGGASAVILVLTGWYLWRNRAELAPWDALNVILPAAFVSTAYLWSYDQVPYIIPLTWIAIKLVQRTNSYAATIAFTLILVMTSLVALVVQANTRSDLLSILTTVLVLGGIAILNTRPSGLTATES